MNMQRNPNETWSQMKRRELRENWKSMVLALLHWLIIPTLMLVAIVSYQKSPVLAFLLFIGSIAHMPTAGEHLEREF